MKVYFFLLYEIDSVLFAVESAVLAKGKQCENILRCETPISKTLGIGFEVKRPFLLLSVLVRGEGIAFKWF